MRLYSLFLMVALFFASCTTNYETEELYGAWQGETLGMTLNEDGTATLTSNGISFSDNIQWRDAIGNTLEFTSNGKVILSNVTVKSVNADTLTIEMRPLVSRKEVATEVHHLLKVK